MKLSIVTPSFRNSDWLKLCIASVADQQGVEVEHIVQDAGSDDGTLDWLTHDPRVKAFVEKDSGMYDAVNRGLRRSEGQIAGYINCDEQYLPGALKAVHDFFVEHPLIDVLFTDTVVIDSTGNYICHRKSHVPTRHDIWVRMPVMTCAMFFRRKVMDEHGVFFDTRWRDFGDVFWVMAVVNKRIPIAVRHIFTSVFTDTGENMNLKPNARRECELKNAMAPRWIRRAKPLFQLAYRTKFILGGAFWQKPFSYSIYTPGSPNRRADFEVAKPTPIWRSRANAA